MSPLLVRVVDRLGLWTVRARRPAGSAGIGRALALLLSLATLPALAATTAGALALAPRVAAAQDPSEEPPATSDERAPADEPAGDEAASPTARQPARVMPEGAVVTIVTTGYEAALAALADTAVSGLFDSEEMKRVSETVRKRYEAKVAATEALVDLAEDLDVEIDLTTRVSRAAEDLAEVPWDYIEMRLYPPEGDDDEADPRVLGVLLHRPDQEPVIRETLDEVTGIAEETGDIRAPVRARELDGRPIVEIRSTEAEDDVPFAYWLGDGELWFGFNATDLLESLEPAPAQNGDDSSDLPGARELFSRGSALATLDVDVAAILEWEREHGDEEDLGDTRRAFDMLGIPSLRRVRAGVAADGPNLRETILLEMDETKKGLIAAMRPIPAEGEGSPPPVPKLDPELMHVRGSFDIDTVLDAMVAYDEAQAEARAAELARRSRAEAGRDGENGEGDGDDGQEGDTSGDDDDGAEAYRSLDEEAITAWRKLFAGFDGGMAMTLAAPEIGGLLPLPRVIFSFGIADDEKYAKALADVKMRMEGIGFDDQKYKEVPITIVRIPNNPSPIIPCFAVIDGALYIAETPMTLRTLIGQLKNGAGDGAARPAVSAERRDVITCDYDTRQIFRLLYEKVLPLAQLGMSQMQRMTGSTAEPLLNIAELPRPEIIGQHLGEGEARITWTEGGLVMTAASAIGDPIGAMIASFSVPFAPMQMGAALDADRAEWERRVVRARLGKVYEALKLHRNTFGSDKRWPSTLGDLYTRGLLEDESMLRVPSDDDPARVEYETLDGDIAEVESSFKYLPDSKLTAKESRLKRRFFGPEVLQNLQITVDGKTVDIEPEELREKIDRDKTILLYESDRNKHDGRFLVTDDGQIYHVAEEAFAEIVAQQ